MQQSPVNLVRALLLLRFCGSSPQQLGFNGISIKANTIFEFESSFEDSNLRFKIPIFVRELKFVRRKYPSPVGLMDKMPETWRWMEYRQVCVWIDTCYIKQYEMHPTIKDQSQNCTALCVVEILWRLPYFRGHPNIDVLIGSIGSVAAAHVRMKRSLYGIVTDLGLLADRPAAIPIIRAPLDIVRDPVPNPGWKPLLLSTHYVSSYKGLVEVSDYIASLWNHTHLIVPILGDENIHKRCLKLL